MNRGHSYGVDHWALGIVIYEMITGENPFHYDGMDQMSLFEAIVKEEMYPLPDATTEAAFEVIDGLLQKDSTHRLGMLAGGEKDILTHRWFEGINLTDMRAKKIKAPWS
jgi:serine/threonine protein kinase